MNDTSIALNRFGLGARPDDAPPADPKHWLLAQFDRFDPAAAPIAAAPKTADVALELFQYRTGAKVARRARKAKVAAPTQMAATPPAASGADAAMRARKAERQLVKSCYFTAIGARTTAALVTPAPFVERLVHFWANHFAVSADKLDVIGLAGPFEFEAIRPHVLGRFADMLNAVEQHPAMLIYLDQAGSIGPDSPFSLRFAARGKREQGLNENLGREIMELHTLGVRTGYTQADVTEFARALTGRTVAGIGHRIARRLEGTAPGSFVFAPQLHQPGVRTIMGKRYAQPGEGQARAVLADLAVHPATATHIATKLARHFVSNSPPPALVERMKAAFLTSNGDLPTVYRAMLDSPEAWAPTAAKFKSPWGWLLSSMRAVDMRQQAPKTVAQLMIQLGQPVWKPKSPAGYEDVAGTWAGPDAVMRRVEMAGRFAALGTVDARNLARQLFPQAVSAATAQALARAESPAQARALLLVSPEMMRS